MNQQSWPTEAGVIINGVFFQNRVHTPAENAQEEQEVARIEWDHAHPSWEMCDYLVLLSIPAVVWILFLIYMLFRQEDR